MEAAWGNRLLPQAALALALGIHKLAEACPRLDTLRVMNEARQREALAAPEGWGGRSQQQPQGGMAGATGGGLGGGAGGEGPGTGGGHAPWLSALSGLKSLRRLTLSGLKLGSADVEALAASCPALEVREVTATMGSVPCSGDGAFGEGMRGWWSEANFLT